MSALGQQGTALGCVWQAQQATPPSSPAGPYHLLELLSSATILELRMIRHACIQIDQRSDPHSAEVAPKSALGRRPFALPPAAASVPTFQDQVVQVQAIELRAFALGSCVPSCADGRARCNLALARGLMPGTSLAVAQPALQGLRGQVQAVQRHLLQRVLHQRMRIFEVERAHKRLALQEQRIPALRSRSGIAH